MSKPTKKMRAWNELIKAIIRPPKRYKHQRDGNTEAKIKRLRKEI